MIISASRRTDIPALYSEWFMNRLREGRVMVPNPYNRKKISRIRLSPDTVDCIVFWTKNPEPLLPYLKEIDDMGYQYYFQITITDYRDDLEPGVPCTEDVMATMLLLSETIGQERIDWRFDPIILTDRYTADYHADMFETMCQWLNKAAERCIISFVDSYRGTHYPELEQEEIEAVAERLSRIASRYRVPLYACAEKTDLARYGIGHSSCIDKEKIKRVIGYKLDLKKDRGQRPQCRCVESIDIGMYNTCTNDCKYCYANGSLESVKKKCSQHDPESHMLIGNLRGDEEIIDRKVQTSTDYQMSLFEMPGLGLGTGYF